MAVGPAPRTPPQPLGASQEPDTFASELLQPLLDLLDELIPFLQGADDVAGSHLPGRVEPAKGRVGTEALAKRAIYEAGLSKAATKWGKTLEFRGTKASTIGT